MGASHTPAQKGTELGSRSLRTCPELATGLQGSTAGPTTVASPGSESLAPSSRSQAPSKGEALPANPNSICLLTRGQALPTPGVALLPAARLVCPAPSTASPPLCCGQPSPSRLQALAPGLLQPLREQ